MKRHARQAAERRGRRAEAFAAIILRLKGYRILARRHRTAAGEIDMVARRGRRIAFIEVKERGTLSAAAESITPRQQARIQRAAEHWLAHNPPSGNFDVSFDVILVAPWTIPRHIVSAFRA